MTTTTDRPSTPSRTRHPTRRRNVRLLVTVALLALLVLWLFARFGPTSSEQRSFTMDPGTTRLTVEVGTGWVRLTPSDDSQIQVQRTVRSGWPDPQIEERTDGSHAVIEASCPGLLPGRCEVRYDIAVPAGHDVELEASTGDLDVRGIEARSLRTTVSTGRTTLVDVDAPLEIRASTGDVSASGLRSDQVTADVSTGSVELDFATAPTDVTVSASSGDVTLELPQAGNPYRVQVSTSSGDERIGVPTDLRSPRSVAVTASSGDIAVRPR
jgi:putative adhesin